MLTLSPGISLEIGGEVFVGTNIDDRPAN